MKQLCFSVLLLLIISLHVVGKDRAWREGKLIDTTRKYFETGGGSRVTGEVNRYGEFEGHSTDSSWGHNRYTFAVEDKTYIYVFSTVLSWRWSKEAKVTVNAPIKFAIEGDKAYILDEVGREHKLRIEKRTLKEPENKSAGGAVTVNASVDNNSTPSPPPSSASSSPPNPKDLPDAGEQPAPKSVPLRSNSEETTNTKMGYANCGESLREVPVSSSKTGLKSLSCGEKVTILGRSGAWIRIRNKDNAEGFVAERFIGQIR